MSLVNIELRDDISRCFFVFTPVIIYCEFDIFSVQQLQLQLACVIMGCVLYGYDLFIMCLSVVVLCILKHKIQHLKPQPKP